MKSAHRAGITEVADLDRSRPSGENGGAGVLGEALQVDGSKPSNQSRITRIHFARVSSTQHRPFGRS